jgi:prolipoprotein diacylglyceryltransferase
MTPGRAAYSFFMLLGFAMFVLARRVTPRLPAQAALQPWQRWALTGSALVGGFLGARVPFALAALASGTPTSGVTGLWALDVWLADGKTITTGLMGAYLGVELAKWLVGVRIKTGDTYALPLALALAVGRWGCFCYGCCHGTPTNLPWGVPFLVDGESVVCHPTQVYESLFHFGMALVLADLIRRGALVNHRLQLYLIAYAGFRFLTEFIRPEPRGLLGLTFFQLAALVLACGLAAQWVWDRVPVQALPRPGVGERESGVEAS